MNEFDYFSSIFRYRDFMKDCPSGVLQKEVSNCDEVLKVHQSKVKQPQKLFSTMNFVPVLSVYSEVHFCSL